MRHVLILLLLAACSTPTYYKSSRWPSALRLDNVTEDYDFTLFSGPEMPEETVILKSLINAPMRVEILDNDRKVHCYSSSDKKEDSVFILEPNIKGNYDHIACKLDHSGKEYPESKKIKVRVTIQLDEYEIPENEFKNKNELLAFEKMIDDLAPWTPELTSFVNAQLNLSKVYVHSSQSGAQQILLPNDEPYYLNIESFQGQFKAPGLFGKKIEAKGLKKHKKSTYDYNEKAVVCGNQVEDGIIQNIIMAEGEIGEMNPIREGFYCAINFRVDEKSIDKHEGALEVYLKMASYSRVKQIIQFSLANEMNQLQRRINTYHQNELTRLTHILSGVQETATRWETQKAVTIARIDSEKFRVYKESVINDLFPKEIKGEVARSGNMFTISPLKKIIYNQSGDQKKLLYLNVKNSISYKIATSEFSEQLHRPLPFEEQVNLYLVTNEEFKDQKEVSLNVCTSQLNRFYSILAQLQRDMTASPVSQNTIVNALKAVSVRSIADCALGSEDKKEIVYNRGSGKTDFIIQWNRTFVGNNEELKAKAVGNTYSSNIMGEALKKDLYRPKNSIHPVFVKDTKLTIKKGSRDSQWDEEQKVYVEKYDEDNFIKIAD
jgi:hypothetical protein